MNTREIQLALQAKGFDPGPIDGVRGRMTIAAVKAFQAANATYVDRRRQFDRIRRKLHPKRLAKAALRRFRGAAPPA